MIPAKGRPFYLSLNMLNIASDKLVAQEQANQVPF